MQERRDAARLQPARTAGTDRSFGPAGKDGFNVTSTSLAQGDPNCVNGGGRFDSASGTTYACNGTNGKDGAQGPPGPSGISNYRVITAAGDDTTLVGAVCSLVVAYEAIGRRAYRVQVRHPDLAA